MTVKQIRQKIAVCAFFSLAYFIFKSKLSKNKIHGVFLNVGVILGGLGHSLQPIPEALAQSLIL